MIDAASYRTAIEASLDGPSRALEQRIDGAIQASIIAEGSPIRIAVKEFPLRIRDRVMRKYREAGWTVDEHHDARDGDYVELSP